METKSYNFKNNIELMKSLYTDIAKYVEQFKEYLNETKSPFTLKEKLNEIKLKIEELENYWTEVEMVFQKEFNIPDTLNEFYKLIEKTTRINYKEKLKQQEIIKDESAKLLLQISDEESKSDLKELINKSEKKIEHLQELIKNIGCISIEATIKIDQTPCQEISEIPLTETIIEENQLDEEKPTFKAIRGVSAQNFEKLILSNLTISLQDILDICNEIINNNDLEILSDKIKEFIDKSNQTIKPLFYAKIHEILCYIDAGGKNDQLEDTEIIISPLSNWFPDFLSENKNLTIDELAGWLLIESTEFRKIALNYEVLKGFRPSNNKAGQQKVIWNKSFKDMVNRRIQSIDVKSEEYRKLKDDKIETEEKEVQHTIIDTQEDAEIVSKIDIIESQNKFEIKSNEVQVETKAELLIQEETEIIQKTIEDEKEYAILEFSNDKTSRELVNIALENNSIDKGTIIHNLIWRLIFEKSLSLAYLLTNYYKEGDLEPFIPSWLIKSVILSRNICHYNGEIAQILAIEIKKYNENCFIKGFSKWNQAIRLLLISSSLRPSLLAPNTGAPVIFQQLHIKEGLSELYKFYKTIAEFGLLGRPIDSISLKSAIDSETWQHNIEAHSQQVDTWIKQAHLIAIPFAPANKVWHKMLEKGEIVQQLLKHVINNDLTKLKEIETFIEKFSDVNKIDNEITNIDRNILKRRSGQKIMAIPLTQIRKHFFKAISLADCWVNMQNLKPNQSNQFIQKQIEKLSSNILSMKDSVLKELNYYKERDTDLLIQGGIVTCYDAVINIINLFDPDIPLEINESDFRVLLNSEILKMHNIYMDENWEPVLTEKENHHEFITELLTLINNYNEIDWEKAFHYRCELRDHEGTERIIELTESENKLSSTLIDKFKNERKENIIQCQSSLKRDIENASSGIENLVAIGILSENQRLSMIAKIEAIKNNISIVLRFKEKHDELNAIQNEIKKIKIEATKNVRKRLESLNLKPNSFEFIKISDLLQKEDVLTANDYIDRINAGQDISLGNLSQNYFMDYFPKKAGIIEKLFEDQHPRQIIRKVRERDFIEGIELNKVAGAQSKQYARALEAWFEQKNNKNELDKGNIRLIMEFLGFNILDIIFYNNQSRYWIDAIVEPIRDKDRCPIPFFGSEANGHYYILCEWSRPTEEDLIDVILRRASKKPIIILYFSRMTELKRRYIAHLCREKSLSFILVDDTMMLYLCGVRGSRLPVLFNCTLPFTYNEPYGSVALVPPEMFFGRNREKEAIMNTTGSSAGFIYGGRQLGKTALLREVERSFHSPQENRIALWVDLKSEGIGYNLSIDEIWSILIRDLKKMGVLPERTLQHNDQNRFSHLIAEWLDTDQRRRILLLLDEADNFLEGDGKNDFIRCSTMRLLMDKTQRRFKVVFAGLHNVQRTTKQVNDPLIHFGDSICIGPLLNDGEWKESHALIEKPFLNMGYIFESPDLITRILSYTNYYPSLIQLFCKQLLKHLTSKYNAGFANYKETPPYIITSKHIDEIFQNRDLQNSIRHRFMLTLRLDPRYELIAYLIAFESLHNEKGIIDGFNVSFIKQESLTWWSKGFGKIRTEETFRNLLDEMVGLGILRESKKGYYALRSPNIVTLIGTKEEVENVLISFENHEEPLEYEASTFRSPLHNPSIEQGHFRSPLTAYHESLFTNLKNEVYVIYGLEASGIDLLDLFLKSLFDKNHFFIINNIIDKTIFSERLIELKNKVSTSGLVVIYVTPDCPWSMEWINDAVTMVSKKYSKNSFLKIMFGSDPKLAWQVIKQTDYNMNNIKDNGILNISLSPWHDNALIRWLTDCLYVNISVDDRKRILEVTGNWWFLINKFYEKSKDSTHSWKEHLDNLENVVNNNIGQDIVKAFGLDCSETKIVLNSMTMLGISSLEKIMSNVQDIPVIIIEKCIKWAELLNIIRYAGNDSWEIDPVISKILLSTME